MKKSIGNVVFLVLFCVGLFGGWFALDATMAYARESGAQQAKAMIMEQSRSLPDVVLVKKAMPDNGQVCAEPPSGGIVACKTVAEFRAWVREPKK